jgi:predicted ABC-type transport system involved in lysophospholipase L1 biosynthesis ATPase subunit
LLQLDRVSKTLWRGAHPLAVLEDVSLEVRVGELVALHGGRRTGKTTLLGIAAGLLLPDAGVVRFDGADLARLSESEHARLLRERLGWARCCDEPLCDMEALHHVATPLLVEHGRRAAERRAAETLALVGAERCGSTTWGRLTDVERTLVTLARALGRRPALLLVDDPTIGLEPDERERVVGLLRDQAETAGLGILMAVTDKPATRHAHRVWSLRDGRVAASVTPPDGGGRVIRFPVGR